jgi:hypothetical protein
MQHQTEYSFMASLQSLNEQAHTAKFYIMNTSRNRNRWGVTGQALSDALPTLKGVKIGMGAGYKIDKHYHEGATMDSGSFIDYENPGSYAVGTAKIEDPQTWSMMKAHELGPVSVVISCFRDTCSSCGADLTAIEDPTGTHKCLRDGDAYSRVESFRFKRVDFVDTPAYPQAGLLDMSAAASRELCASFYESQGKFDKTVEEIRDGIAFLEARQEEDLAKAIKEMRADYGFPDTKMQALAPNPYAWKYSLDAAIEKRRRELGFSKT